MPDHDRGLTTVLERLSDRGQTAARPQPAALLRATAKRRTRRHRVAMTAALVLVVAGGSALLTNGGQATRSENQRTPAAQSHGPAPTQLATAPADDSSEPREITDDMVLTAGEVASTLGTMWDWRLTDSGDGSNALTPCQTAPSADPGRQAARSVVVTGGWSGDDTLSQLVEQSRDADAARPAYEAAVRWFTDCGGTGVDQSNSRDSLARRAALRPAIDGVDDMRIIVRRRAKVGTESWTNTVAAVIRAGNLVTVLAWDVTIDDDPGAYDDGFVELARLVGRRLAGTERRGDSGPSQVPQSIPDSALLSPNDPAVRDALGDAQGSVITMAKVPELDPLCQRGYAAPAPGTVAVRTPQIVGDGTTAILLEFVTRYESEASADAAASAAASAVGRCPTAERIDGSRRNLDVTVPEVDAVQAWAGTFQDVGAARNRHRAVVRDGDLVAYLVIDSRNRNVTDSQASAIIKAAAQRLHAATR